MVDPPWLRFVHDECLLSPRAWVCGSALNNARLAWARKHHVTLPPAASWSPTSPRRGWPWPCRAGWPPGSVCEISGVSGRRSERLRDYVVALRSRAG